jgi:hypothetical protein
LANCPELPKTAKNRVGIMTKTSVMKKILNFCLVLLGSFFFSYHSFAQLAPKTVNPCPCDTGKLYLQPNFKEFAENFLTSYLDYTRVHTPAAENEQSFVDAIKNSDQEEETVSAIYSKYSVNFDSAMFYKNKMDNSILKVLHDFPTLMYLDEDEVWKILINAIGLGMKSGDAGWLSIQQHIFNKALELVPRDHRIAKTNQLRGFRSSLSVSVVLPFFKPKLALAEVWDCILEAVGIGGAATFGIGHLMDIAKKEGLQEVVVTVSKWLAKKAGWIGAIVMVIDFSRCIYYQAID